MPRKYSNGFIAVFPLLLVFAAAVLVISYNKFNFSSEPGIGSNVLSEYTESENSGDSKTPEPQKTEESNSGKSSEGTPKPAETAKPAETQKSFSVENTLRVQKTEKPQKTPKATKTPKPSETPKSSETPKASETPEASEMPETAESESEVEIETEVLEGVTKTKIKIKQNGESFQLEQEGAKAEVQGNFPLSVNQETNELSVTTPAGTKIVTVLPETAVAKVVNTGIVDAVNKDSNGVNGVSIKADTQGNAVYEIKGDRSKKIFGFIKVSVPKSTQVSLSTGEIVKVEQSLMSRLLDLVSI